MINSPRLITVRFVCGTHQTNTVRGQRASSTCSYHQAAASLAAKLHPGQAVELRRVPGRCAPGMEAYELLLASDTQDDADDEDVYHHD